MVMLCILKPVSFKDHFSIPWLFALKSLREFIQHISVTHSFFLVLNFLLTLLADDSNIS